MQKAFDIIGDIHGHSDALERLLQVLGYRRKSGVYTHPDRRQVIFVGDFIDRGPRIRETLHIVRDMCDEGDARAVMGNHEFNAICFHTPHLERGGFFRDHSWKEINQHMSTLEQFRNYRDEWQEFLEWFKTLPLWIEEESFRVVHACWDQDHINYLSGIDCSMSPEFLCRSADSYNRDIDYHAVNDIIKGKEEPLPDGQHFTDRDGVVRNACRIKWWALPSLRQNYGDYLLDCPDAMKKNSLSDKERNLSAYLDEKPVFFGHYWLKGNPVIINPNAICVDYSIAKGGCLAAYSLDTGKFTWVG